MKQFIKDHDVHFLMIGVCFAMLFLIGISNALADEPAVTIYQCKTVELTDKVTVRNRSGDPIFLDGDKKVISKSTAIKKLLAAQK